MKFNFKSFLPYLGIMALFALVACLYCSPELEGQRIVAADAQQPTSAMKESWRYHQQTGDYTWWTGSMFCGMPNYQIGGGDGVLADGGATGLATADDFALAARQLFEEFDVFVVDEHRARTFAVDAQRIAFLAADLRLDLR